VGTAYSRKAAIEHLRNAASATSLPFIYLSAGSSDQVFCEMLELAAEAGVKYSGVLCGRATWQEAIPIYAAQGVAALEGWLAERGRQNIQALNDVLARGATAWWEAYGGKDNLEVIESFNRAL
jgi:tagatose 1,6-diphosphate aldolase